MSHRRPHRPALAVACLLAGLTVATVGAAAASWIGPDDWVDYRSTVANPNGERIVRTGYGVLNFGLPSRVRASTEGDVFVGVGHAVDTDDYLAGVTLSQVDHVDPLRIETAAVPGGSPTPPVPPTGLGIWRTSSHGAGVQQLSGDFTGEPVQAVVVALAPHAGPIVLTLSVHLTGSHLAAWVLVVTGLAASAAALRWLRPRTEPPPQQREPRKTDGPADNPTSGSAARVVAAVSLVALFAASGCGLTVSAPPALVERAELTRPAPTLEEVRAAVAELSPRINAARQSQGWPTNSLSKQADAFAEPVLGVVRLNVAWYRATRKKWAPTAITHVVERVLAGPAAAYPLTMTTIEQPRSEKASDPKERYLVVYVKEHSYTPWKLAGELSGKPADLPAPGAAALAPEAAAAGKLLAAQLMDQVITGNRHGGVKLPAKFWTYRKNALKVENFETARWIRPTLEPHLVHTVATPDGTLVYVGFVARTVYRSKDDDGIYWKSPYDDIQNCHGSHLILTADTALEFAVRVGADGSRVDLWDANDYLSEHAGC
jgi:hypothetical protein